MLQFNQQFFWAIIHTFALQDLFSLLVLLIALYLLYTVLGQKITS